MKYEKINHLKKEEFRRLTGILPETFEKMSLILKEEEREKKRKEENPTN
jgi:hypothetical protein